MANVNSTNDPFQSAFDVAAQEFRARLKNDDLYHEIAQTKSIDEVYNLTDKLQEEQSRTGRLRHLSKMQPFLEGLRGYASVIEVFMQAKPDILALLWGPIKLLLQWADVLKQSMDAVIEITAEIGTLIPEFRTSSNLFGQKTAVREVLVLFFRDILEFYIIALKFFSSPLLKTIFESFWPRQRDKIKVVVSHIQRHTHLLRNEVRLEHIQAEYEFRRNALDQFDKAEAAHQRQEYQALRTSFNTPMYEEKLQYLDDRTVKDAGSWLLKHNVFRSWIGRLNSSDSVLWLQGIPGSGKSHLARTVVHEARERGRSIFAFLSHTHANKASTISILHSLIFQVATEDPLLQSIVCRSSGEKFRHDVEAVKNVFKTVLSSAGEVFITIDGLDEIDGAPRCQVLKALLQISHEVDEVRLLVSCRPEDDIASLLREKSSTIRINELNSSGIQSFVKQRTSRWYTEREFVPEMQKEIENSLSLLAEKSQGMFLYSKIVLDTVEFMDADEILEDLKILPETMDDAYGRILKRINQQPASHREKARSVIGWIGVTPVPIAVQELEQALLVKSQGLDGLATVKSNFPIHRLCGPIVEIVDGYVQFVHFTVKEYFLSSEIRTSIDYKEATLDLTICCLTYLSQRHHDRDIEPQARRELILTGAYRFHWFAISNWLDLVQAVLSQISLAELPSGLIKILDIYRTRREIESASNSFNSDTPAYKTQLKVQHPSLATMLLKSTLYRATCSRSFFATKGNTQWAKADPLDLSLTSCRIAKEVEDILTVAQQGDPKIRTFLTRHCGVRWYKCRFMYCRFQRDGFESKAARDSHEAKHEKPWNCDVEGCEFKEGGFLSRKMRDEHLEFFHRVPTDGPKSAVTRLCDTDGFAKICLDLVKADDISTIRDLLESGKIDLATQGGDLAVCAAQYASPELLKILIERDDIKYWYTNETLLISQIVAGNNAKILEYVLQATEGIWKSSMAGRWLIRQFWSNKENGLPKVLAHGNDEMLDIFCRWVGEELLRGKMSRGHLVQSNMISATAEDVYREQVLLGIWKKAPSDIWLKDAWKNAIVNVASTTCSLVLTKFLVEKGVPVDWRASKVGFTALAHAARNCTAQGAELVKYLLFAGANTTVEIAKYKGGKIQAESSTIHVSEQKGARQISQWLGVSFNELVAQAMKARQASEGSDTPSELEAGKILEEPISESIE